MAKRAIHYNARGRTACGKLIVVSGPVSVQRKLRPSQVLGWQTTYVGDAVTCTPCRRWLALTPEQRVEAKQREKATARERFARLKVTSDWHRAMTKLWAQIAIEMARELGAPALDAFEESLMGRVLDAPQKRMLGVALTFALRAHRTENPKSRGDRLWIYRPVTEMTGKRRHGRAHIVCRFCACRLLADVSMAVHETHHETRRVGNGADESVGAHVTRCALRYLIRLPRHAA